MQTQHPNNQRGARPEPSSRDTRNWEEEFRESWILEDIDKKCIEFARDLGWYINKQGMSTTQIRNVFGELKRIQMKGLQHNKSAFYLLKPKMAYSVARNARGGIKDLAKVFDKAYSLIDPETPQGKKQYSNLIDFMEAVLAYHKYYGGK